MRPAKCLHTYLYFVPFDGCTSEIPEHIKMYFANEFKTDFFGKNLGK